MDKITLQQTLDIDKWLNSEKLRRDLCGEYDYCAYCENEKEYPCALAYMRMESKKQAKTQNKTPVIVDNKLNINAAIEEMNEVMTEKTNCKTPAKSIDQSNIIKNEIIVNSTIISTADNDKHNVNQNNDNIAEINGEEILVNSNKIGNTSDITDMDIVTIPNNSAEIAASLLNVNKSISAHRKIKTFAEKFAILKPEIKNSFVIIEKAFAEYGIKSKMTKKYVNFRLKRNLVGIVSINRGCLRLQLALSPDDYRDSKIPYDDYSNKKCYSKVPFSMKIKSPLSLRRACKLIGDVVNKIKENL